MQAAADVVGEEGYTAASIAKITARAGVAHGTFYSYFDDRQQLFDVLLPFVGR
ncbi:MAG: TetR/AcrR family transcriptional regulator [Dehalococcoidia bacterium]